MTSKIASQYSNKIAVGGIANRERWIDIWNQHRSGERIAHFESELIVYNPDAFVEEKALWMKI